MYFSRLNSIQNCDFSLLHVSLSDFQPFYAEFAAKQTGLSVEDVKLMAPWYDFSTAITDKDIKDLEETQDFLIANDMQKKKIDIKSMLAEVK